MVLSFTAGVIALAGRLPEDRKVKRDLARRRLDSLGALADGKVVTLRGIVRDVEGVTTGPVTGRRCVYVRTTEVHGRHADRSERSIPFELETSDGRIRVVASAPRLGVHGETKQGPDGVTIEHAVPVDAVITIRGICTYEPDPTRNDVDGVYRGGERATRPVISGTRKVPLQIG